MYKQRVILKDGTELSARGALNEVSGDLWIWVDPGETMKHLADIFTDSSKIEEITIKFWPMEDTVFTGYTVLNALILKHNGAIDVRLNQP